jgi:hypothetical protein
MIRRPHISERQQVALILFLALLGLALVWFLLLKPQMRVRAENEQIRQQLASSPYANLSMESLKEVAAQETQAEQRLQKEWTAACQRLATFSNQGAVRRANLARIDYKVELFNTRQRLLAKSDSLGIPLIPVDLGLDEALATNAQIRDRMLQLKAVEYLADLALDNRIQQLVALAPMAAVEHPGPDGRLVFTEYPVQVTFDADFVNLYQLFQSVFEENRVFAFHAIRAMSGPDLESRLRIQAILSALVFE